MFKKFMYSSSMYHECKAPFLLSVSNSSPGKYVELLINTFPFLYFSWIRNNPYL